MWRRTLDYSPTPGTAARRRAFRVVGVVAGILCAGTLAMWVRSYITGDYVYLGRFCLSFACGYCRVVNGSWPFAPGDPIVRKPLVTYPLDKVGEYHLGSGAIYVLLWLLTLVSTVVCVWSIRRSRALGHTATK